MKVAHTAAAFNLPVAPHWHANLHVHLTAAVSNGLVVECFVLEQDIYNFERLITPETRLQPRAGRLPVPRMPGVGIEWDDEAIVQRAIASDSLTSPPPTTPSELRRCVAEIGRLASLTSPPPTTPGKTGAGWLTGSTRASFAWYVVAPPRMLRGRGGQNQSSRRRRAVQQPC